VTDEVTLTLPAQEDFRHVAHLVVGGLGARREMTYEELEDLQVAFDAILACRDDDEDIIVTMSIEGGVVRASVGPFDEAALEQLDEGPDGLAPRRVIETVCDSVSLTERDGGAWVEVTKRVSV
jgi:anti-sigma regulatory factor (Ser/Thr protein kinase)